MEGTATYTGVGSLVAGLLGFTAILLLAYWVVWYLGKRMNVSGVARHIRIADRVVLGGEKQLLLVRVGKRVLLLGVTSRSCETLSDLSEDEELQQAFDNPSEMENKFSQLLEKRLSKWNIPLGKGRESDG